MPEIVKMEVRQASAVTSRVKGVLDIIHRFPTASWNTQDTSC